uniref:Uncharacterized protein LOC111115958 n=1 Tax=Crassostrea virginica TaxID=6565 RepID=A0A8B8C647_CRAVI|nr:uncharacterized protein LOC111115958 [Crassostrea virginica]
MRCNILNTLMIWILLDTAGATNRSEFKASAVYNQTHATVSCEVLSPKLSTETVFLRNNESMLGECQWKGADHQCTDGAQALPNGRGVKITTTYQSSLNLKCGINGTEVDVVMEEESTTVQHSSQNLSLSEFINNGQCSKTGFYPVQVLTLNLICLIFCHI